MRRATTLLLLVVFVVSACSSGPTASTTPMPVASFPTPDQPGASVPAASSPPSDGGGDANPVPLPADIVAAVDAILEGPSAEDRVAATTALLESVGVTISGDEEASATSAAGIVLAPEEIEIMAAEAADRSTHRATLAEFAETFGGMSLLPPNDALAADLVEGWLETEPPTETQLDANIQLDLAPLPRHLASVINAWVISSSENHASSDPELVGLTDAPLLLTELARRRPAPVDLGQTFSPNDVRLGWLEITVLIAGLRSMLAAAEASGVAAQPVSIVLAGNHLPAPSEQAPLATATPCDTLKQMIDSRVPLVSTYIGSYIGDQVKGFIQQFVNSLFGEASAFAQGVGRAFKVLGLIAKVQALILIYSESEAEVTLEPSIYHKPDGSRTNAGATVEVGIPDAAWEAARQARELSPFATATRVCARFLGLPVWQDLTDVGNALGAWKVQWELTSGGQHVEIPTRDQFTSGRMERPLTRTSDHAAIDAITYDVLPERRENHPGTEQTETVELCAHVLPKEPPNGFKDALSAAGVVAGVATGGYSALVGVIAGLLTGWVKAVAGINDCGQATVSYHVPLPGQWHGTITATTEKSQSGSSASTEDNYPFGTAAYTGSWSTSVWVRDTIHVGGVDDEHVSGYVSLQGRQYTGGSATDVRNGTGINVTAAACGYDVIETAQSGGTWHFESDADGIISLYADGRYTISWYAGQPSEEVILEGETARQVSPYSDNCIDTGTGTEERPYWPSPLTGSADQSMVEGQLDPEHPGSALKGSQTFVNEYDLSTTTIEWNLVHEGPIRLPGY